jgi:hypothetical protein
MTEDEYCVYEVLAVDNMRITRVKTTVKVRPVEEEIEE